MSNAFRTLTGVTLLSLLLAAVLALLSVLMMGTRTGAVTHLHPTIQVSTVWTTTWRSDSSTALFRSALSAGDGEAQPTNGGEPQPALVGSILYALGSDRKVHALNPRTGSDQVFEVGPGRRAVNFRPSSSRLVMVTRTPNSATGLPDSALVGIDPTTRAIAWDQSLGADVFTNSIEVDTDTVYLGVGDSVDGAQWKLFRDRGSAPSLHPRVRAYALASGALRWEQALPERTDTGPTDDLGLGVAGGELVATEFARRVTVGVVGLDRGSGQIPWRDLTGTQALGTLRNRLVAVSGEDVVMMIPTTGAIVDRLTGLAPSKPGSALVSGTALYWTRSDQVGALDLDRKKVLWQPTQLDYPTSGAGARPLSRPSVENGHLYVGGRDEAVYSIELKTGSVAWKFPAPLRASPGTDYPPLRVGNLVLVQDGQLTAYQAPF